MKIKAEVWKKWVLKKHKGLFDSVFIFYCV